MTDLTPERIAKYQAEIVSAQAQIANIQEAVSELDRLMCSVYAPDSYTSTPAVKVLSNAQSDLLGCIVDLQDEIKEIEEYLNPTEDDDE